MGSHLAGISSEPRRETTVGVCVASPREGKTARLKGAGWGEGFQRSQGSRLCQGRNRPPLSRAL